MKEKVVRRRRKGFGIVRARTWYSIELGIFPQYEVAINNYLQRFNAGFRLTEVTSVNTRGGSAVSYSVLINAVAVPLAAGNPLGPSFRNTLSAGDRSALALAFFFASLERDPQRAQKIVVIDDPISSLDEHRSLVTIQEMRRLADGGASYCALTLQGVPLRAVARRRHCDAIGDQAGPRRVGSTLSAWDVNQDAITEHDRRYRLVLDYFGTHSAAEERAVAAALRPILESFMREAYSDVFHLARSWTLHRTCLAKGWHPSRDTVGDRTAELRDLLDYANQFHHDTNPAWQTVTINDSELTHFSQRVMAFARRR